MIPARVMRSGSPQAHAATYGPPPETPITAKLPDAEGISQLAHVIRPVCDPTSRQPRRQSQARTIGRDDPNAARQRRAMRRAHLQTRAGAAVEHEKRLAVGRTELGVAQGAAVTQTQPQVFEGNAHELSSTVTRAALRQKLGIAALRECTPRRRCGTSCAGFEVVSGCVGSGS